MKHAVLLINLGTPDDPSRGAVRRYLREFLSDARVIDIPAVLRWLLVNGVIAPFRSGPSSRQYQAVWGSGEHGSPLMQNSILLRDALQQRLGDKASCYLAMRYGRPAIRDVLEQIRSEGVQRLLVLPLYPQYASATTGSVIERVMQVMNSWDTVPSVHIVHDLLYRPGFVESWGQIVQPNLDKGQWDHLLFSFHGLPQRQVRRSCPRNCMPGACPATPQAFCYRSECFATAKQIAEQLQLKPTDWSCSFQSRLGKGWLEPWSDVVVGEMPGRGIKRLLVCSPAFTADCLETTYELNVELRQLFIDAGGEEFTLVPSLNAHPTWVQTLERIAHQVLD